MIKMLITLLNHTPFPLPLPLCPEITHENAAPVKEKQGTAWWMSSPQIVFYGIPGEPHCTTQLFYLLPFHKLQNLTEPAPTTPPPPLLFFFFFLLEVAISYSAWFTFVHEFATLSKHNGKFCTELWTAHPMIYSPTSFRSGHHVVLCWLVKSIMIWVRFQRSNECSLPHLIAADISLHQWTHTII